MAVKRTRAHPLAVCSALCLVAGLQAEDWPQWRGTDRSAVWTDVGVVDRFPNTGLTVTWRTPVRGGFAGPAVAGGRVFVLDYEEPPGRRTMDGTARLLALAEPPAGMFPRGEPVRARGAPHFLAGLTGKHFGRCGPRGNIEKIRKCFPVTPSSERLASLTGKHFRNVSPSTPRPNVSP